MFGRNSEKSADRAWAQRKASTIHNPKLKEAYEKATEELEDERFDMESFVDHYGETAVNTDIARVEKLKAVFAADEARDPEQRETNRLASILEGIISDQIYSSEWFGPGVESKPTSEFDDYVNGIDLVTIFNIKDMAQTHLGLAIDVTFSSYPSKKIKRIKDEIRTGKMPNLKYYEDDVSRGEIKQVPRILLAVSADNTRRAAETWVTDKNGLVDSPMKAQLVMQITGQLELYRDFALQLGDARADIAAVYDRQLRIFTDLVSGLDLESLQTTEEAQEHFFDEDRAHRGLLKELESQFSEVF